MDPDPTTQVPYRSAAPLLATMRNPEGNRSGKYGICNNPKGKNQYQDRPPASDPRFADILRGYHRRGVTDRKELSRLFFSDHGISISETTIARRKRELGLRASHLTTLELDDAVKRQLVLDQMAKDPSGKIGPRTVKKGIFEDTGIHLTRDWIIEAMRSLDPTAYAARGPAHAKARRLNRLALEAQRTESGPSQERSVSPPAENVDVGHPGPSSPQIRATSPVRTTYSIVHPQPSTFSNSCSDLTFAFELPSQIPQKLGSSPFDGGSEPGRPDISEYSNAQAPSISPDIPPLPSSPRYTVTAPYPRDPPGASTSMVPVESHQSGTSRTVVSDALERSTTEIKVLTQLLSGTDSTQARYEPSAYDSVMQCMEAAALLERQLARIASELRRQHPGSIPH